MEESYNSSGCLVLQELSYSCGGLHSWIVILLRAVIALFMVLKLLFSSFQCEAAELGAVNVTAGGEINGTLDNLPDILQSAEGTEIFTSDEEAAVPDAENENISSVSSGDAAALSLASDVTGPDAGTVIGELPVYDSYEEFMESPLYVTRYENEVLKKLEYCQYAQAIMIALLFLLIFKKK